MSASIKQIAAQAPQWAPAGDPEAMVSGITHDSRRVGPGMMFAALRGEVTDGHSFIDMAIRNGAAAILAEEPRPVGIDTPWIQCEDTRAALGVASAAIYRFPTMQIKLVGVTGTNGKTTISYLLEAIIQAHGGRPGVVGTVSYRWADHDTPATNTTPEASELQRMFREMADDGVTHAVIEVSSHGLHRRRLNGCAFDIGVFTNLTQDHLDYHANFESYYAAKRTLFTELLRGSTKGWPIAIINVDDEYGSRLYGELTDVEKIRFGEGAECELHPAGVSISANGIQGEIVTPFGRVQVNSPLTGRFNLMNIMAAVASAQEMGIPIEAIEAGLSNLRQAPGRLERVETPKGAVFVDYAHTPNALENVLSALAAIRQGRIINVMGCGGDRDRTKRPLMGKQAAAGSDFVVITSDNPRSEDPHEIIRQIEAGVQDFGYKPLPSTDDDMQANHYVCIPDRRKAIGWALERLAANDILLVAGKGHETYQEIEGVRYPFDDREVIREASAKP